MTNTAWDQPPMGAQPTATKDVAVDAASQVASTAKEQAGAVADTSKQQVQEVAQDARAHAQQLVGQSREQLRSQANEQAQRVASSLRDVGRQLDAMARGDGAPQGVVADVTHQLSSSATRAGQRLQDGGVEGLMDDVKRFARNRPGVFLLASIGAGFAVGRLLRSADTHALMEAAKPGDSQSPSQPSVSSVSSTSAMVGDPLATVPMAPRPGGGAAIEATFESTGGTIDLRPPEV